MLNKYIFLAVLILCVSLFFSSGEEEKPKPDKPVFRIGSECDYVPNSWEEKKPSAFNHPVANNKGYYADGYDIQIAKLVAGKLGCDLEVRKIAWNDLLPSLNKGEIDAIFSSMLDTDERKEFATFSEPYEIHKTEYALIVSSAGPYITAKTLKDFRGARIIGERGTKLDDVIEQIPGVIHVRPLDSVKEVIDSVLNDKADGAVIEVDTGHFYELSNKNLMLIEFSDGDGFKLNFNGVCAGVRKGNTDLLRRINDALYDINHGERRKIMESVSVRMMTNLHQNNK